MFRSQGLLPALEKRYESLRTSETESFLTKAFNQCIDIAEQTYSTGFIQGIGKGTLSPETYGSVTVLDAYYCYEAAKSIWNTCAKTEADSDLLKLLKDFYNSYTYYNSTFYSGWHVLTSHSVAPTQEFLNYAEHERNVSVNDDAIYLLPALLPCYSLWPWMANKLYEDTTMHPGVYQFWVDGNKGSGSSAKRADKLITDWRAEGKPFDENKALLIFKKSMECELSVFSAQGMY